MKHLFLTQGFFWLLSAAIYMFKPSTGEKWLSRMLLATISIGFYAIIDAIEKKVKP